MLCHTGKRLLAVVVISLPVVAAPANAAVQCPAEVNGHRMRALDGGTIFFGDPAKLGSQAPDGTRQGPRGPVNTWTFRSAANMTLVCRYEGISQPVSVILPADTVICRQDVNARTFACQ